MPAGIPVPGKTGGKNPSFTLAQCDDDGLAAVVKTFPTITKLTIQKSPKLTSVDALKALPLTSLTLKSLPAVADLAPLAALTKLQTLKIDEVGFRNPDLSFCAGMTGLSQFELRKFSASLKSIGGIEKCARIRQLTISHNVGPLDLAPLAGFKTLKRLSLTYVSALDLAPVAQMPELTDLSLYGSKNLDLSPLSGCPKLKYIMIYATKGIKDYGDLAKIQTLETVNAGLTPMNDLSWAPQLPNLKRLDLFAETFATFAPLAECKKLEELTFWSMRAPVDIAQFADGVAPLRKLSVSGSAIVNEAKLASLAKNGKLISLNLSEVNKGKKPVDLSFITSLTTLQEVDLRKGVFTNLDAVAQLPALKKITLDKSQKPLLEGKLKNVRISAY